MKKNKLKKFSKREIFFLLVVIVLLIALAASLVYKGNITDVFFHSPEENDNNQDKIYTSFYSENTNISLPQQFNEDALLEVHFIDVGQGDAILIRLPDQKDIFIDAGSGTTASSQRRDDFSDYLLDMSIDKLEYLIITHPHSDHVNMADILVNYYDINTFMFHNPQDASNTYQNFTQSAQSKENSECIVINDDWEFYTVDSEDYNYKMDIYAPGRAFSNDLNAQSILCLLEYYDTKILLTGDATTKTEQYFIELFDEEKDIDILKVGHHGSGTSASQDFLDFLTPEYAVISVGETNTYNHPSPFTMNRLFNQGIVTYRTNRHGNITLYADDGGNFGFLCETPLPPDNNSLQIDEKMIVLNNN